jgi:hypothetical protein
MKLITSANTLLKKIMLLVALSALIALTANITLQVRHLGNLTGFVYGEYAIGTRLPEVLNCIGKNVDSTVLTTDQSVGLLGIDNSNISCDELIVRTTHRGWFLHHWYSYLEFLAPQKFSDRAITLFISQYGINTSMPVIVALLLRLQNISIYDITCLGLALAFIELAIAYFFLRGTEKDRFWSFALFAILFVPFAFYLIYIDINQLTISPGFAYLRIIPTQLILVLLVFNSDNNTKTKQTAVAIIGLSLINAITLNMLLIAVLCTYIFSDFLLFRLPSATKVTTQAFLMPLLGIASLQYIMTKFGFTTRNILGSISGQKFFYNVLFCWILIAILFLCLFFAWRAVDRVDNIVVKRFIPAFLALGVTCLIPILYSSFYYGSPNHAVVALALYLIIILLILIKYLLVFQPATHKPSIIAGLFFGIGWCYLLFHYYAYAIARPLPSTDVYTSRILRNNTKPMCKSTDTLAIGPIAFKICTNEVASELDYNDMSFLDELNSPRTTILTSFLPLLGLKRYLANYDFENKVFNRALLKGLSDQFLQELALRLTSVCSNHRACISSDFHSAFKDVLYDFENEIKSSDVSRKFAYQHAWNSIDNYVVDRKELIEKNLLTLALIDGYYSSLGHPRYSGVRSELSEKFYMYFYGFISHYQSKLFPRKCLNNLCVLIISK